MGRTELLTTMLSLTAGALIAAGMDDDFPVLPRLPGLPREREYGFEFTAGERQHLSTLHGKARKAYVRYLKDRYAKGVKR